MQNNETAAAQGGTSYNATQTGNGAIALGNGAKAVGERGVMVGGNNSGNINTGTQTQGISAAELTALFAPLLAVIAQAPKDKQVAAMQQVEALRVEIASGEQAKDKNMANIIKNLLEYVPAALGALTSLVSSPVIGYMAGAVTQFVLGI
jgi:hypothetical protein